jgi:hypothetical protein
LEDFNESLACGNKEVRGPTLEDLVAGFGEPYKHEKGEIMSVHLLVSELTTEMHSNKPLD